MKYLSLKELSELTEDQLLPFIRSGCNDRINGEPKNEFLGEADGVFIYAYDYGWDLTRISSEWATSTVYDEAHKIINALKLMHEANLVGNKTPIRHADTAAIFRNWTWHFENWQPLTVPLKGGSVVSLTDIMVDVTRTGGVNNVILRTNQIIYGEDEDYFVAENYVGMNAIGTILTAALQRCPCSGVARQELKATDYLDEAMF